MASNDSDHAEPAATAVKAVKAVVAGGDGAKAAPLPRIRQALALGERRPVALCDAREPPGVRRTETFLVRHALDTALADEAHAQQSTSLPASSRS